MAEVTGSDIGAVLNGLHDSFQRERQQSDQWKTLAGQKTPAKAIDQATHLMTMVVLDLSDVLKTVYDIDVDHGTYAMLKALPLIRGQLTDGFQSQGSYGAADRAKTVLAKMVTEPGASIRLDIDRPSYCVPEAENYCPEHGWSDGPAGHNPGQAGEG